MTPARPALVRGLPAVCTTLLLAGFVLAGCQQSLTTRSAPTPSELLGTAVQPIAAPVILRYGPVAGAAFTASKTGTVSVGAESRTWEDALDGALSIVPAGGGLLRVTARFEALKAELTDELDVGPFGYDGAVPFRGDVSAFSGYYLVDAETGLVVEQRHAVRTKDYRGAHLFLIDYDLETRISI